MAEQKDSGYEEITEKHISEIIKKRNPDSHKGNYGHALIVAGNMGKMGAAVLAAKACLRTGVGLLSMHIPKCGYTILQTTVPEAMVICDKNETMITNTIPLDSYSAIGIGPGMGTSLETTVVVKQFIQNYSKPIVIDADAINIISKNKNWLKFVPANSIFTPHPKEFERLIDITVTAENRHQLQIEFSKQHKIYLILKGHHTAISCPDGKYYINTTGNAGMAKGGSGDTLTGMITSLLAQGYTSEQACVAGVYLHGLAGDIAVKETGEFSLLPSDLIDKIGKAFLTIIK